MTITLLLYNLKLNFLIFTTGLHNSLILFIRTYTVSFWDALDRLCVRLNIILFTKFWFTVVIFITSQEWNTLLNDFSLLDLFIALAMLKRHATAVASGLGIAIMGSRLLSPIPNPKIGSISILGFWDHNNLLYFCKIVLFRVLTVECYKWHFWASNVWNILCTLESYFLLCTVICILIVTVTRFYTSENTTFRRGTRPTTSYAWNTFIGDNKITTNL